MSRVYNFSAGPSMLPLSVLEKVAKEMTDYEGSGCSVMEMSHRSKTYDAIIKGAEATLRELLNIPENYKVLFLQGGASSQFAMVPLNLMVKNNKADYVITGQWSKKAASEAAKYGKVNKVASSEDKVFSYIPKLDKSMFDKSSIPTMIDSALLEEIFWSTIVFTNRLVSLTLAGDIPGVILFRISYTFAKLSV